MITLTRIKTSSLIRITYFFPRVTANKKFQKFYPKTEADWNFKGEVKKGDVFIKDAKDNRLLRLISEGLIGPQDILPIVSNDAISSSQTNCK